MIKLSNEEKNFYEFIDIISIIDENEVINTVDIQVDEDESFCLENQIISHNSAVGGILQRRNSKTQGAYALKGKPKNVKDIEELNNKEFIELMNVIGLNPLAKAQELNYQRVIIAADADYDGKHIQALLINFFYRWFPQVIRDGHLFLLETPIGICKYKGKFQYFYSVAEFDKFISKNKVTDVKYAKGLGSYSIDDWDYIMKNLLVHQITEDEFSSNAINLAFGDDANYRKLWLMNKIEISDVPAI